MRIWWSLLFLFIHIVIAAYFILGGAPILEMGHTRQGQFKPIYHLRNASVLIWGFIYNVNLNDALLTNLNYND